MNKKVMEEKKNERKSHVLDKDWKDGCGGP